MIATRRATVALALGAVLALTGCGNATADTSTEATDTTSTVETVLQNAFGVTDLHEVCDPIEKHDWKCDFETITQPTYNSINLDLDKTKVDIDLGPDKWAEAIALDYLVDTVYKTPDIKFITVTMGGFTLAVDSRASKG